MCKNFSDSKKIEPLSTNDKFTMAKKGYSILIAIIINVKYPKNILVLFIVTYQDFYPSKLYHKTCFEIFLVR